LIIWGCNYVELDGRMVHFSSRFDLWSSLFDYRLSPPGVFKLISFM